MSYFYKKKADFKKYYFSRNENRKWNTKNAKKTKCLQSVTDSIRFSTNVFAYSYKTMRGFQSDMTRVKLGQFKFHHISDDKPFPRSRDRSFSTEITRTIPIIWFPSLESTSQ